MDNRVDNYVDNVWITLLYFFIVFSCFVIFIYITTKTLWCIGNQTTTMDNKIQTLKNVRTKLKTMYDSYNENEFSSPDYEIPEEISDSLVNRSRPYYDKVLSVVMYNVDDSVEELYFGGISDSVMENITQTELEEIFQLILNIEINLYFLFRIINQTY